MKRLLFSMMVLTGLALQASAALKDSQMDADGDGKVSKEEFMVARAKAVKSTGAKFNQAAEEKKFAAKDKDGDGFLSKEELSKKKTSLKPAQQQDDSDSWSEE